MKRARLRVAVVYPNSYIVGMDNLGFQGIFRLFASGANVHCERAFYDKGGVVVSYENRLPLRAFDVLAFSISFENDYLNVLRILRASGIEPLARKRGDGHPLLMAGGAAVSINPEPITPFMDAVFVGEADEAIEEMVHLISDARGWGNEATVESLAEVDGVYVPSLHSPFLCKTGQVTGEVRRRFVSDLSTSFCSTAVSSPRSHLGGMFLMEIGRGCSRRCRFCAATAIYSPLRFVPMESLLERLRQSRSPIRTVGLVGPCVSEYPHLAGLARTLVSEGRRVSLSSLRSDFAPTEVLELMARSGTKTVTIAPEAGTARLRKTINKELEDSDLMTTVQAAGESGLTSLKLYFMIGLPGERREDLVAIPSLVESISSLFRVKGKARFVSVSVSPFVPKPWTPFQWCAMDERSLLEAKSQYLAKEFAGMKGVKFTRQSVRSSILQAALSRGSHRTGEALSAMVFEGLTARKAWQKAGLEFGPEAFAGRDLEAVLPWDHLGVVSSRHRLREEFRKAFGQGEGSRGAT